MNPNNGFIQRCPHDKKNPYVMISRDVIFDKSLKCTPRLVLCGLISLPDNWKLRPKEFAKRIGLNIDTVYDALNKLIEAGYCSKKEIRNERGHRVGFDYFISENPIKKNELSTEKPKRKKPDLEKRVTSIKDNDRIEDSYKNDNDSKTKLFTTPKTTPLPPQTPPTPTACRYRLSSNDDKAIVFNPDTYKLPNGNLLSPRMRNALKKHKGEKYLKLLANIAYAEDYISKGGVENQERYLQRCITDDYAGKVTRQETNRLWATFVGTHLNLRGAGLKKSYFWIKTSGETVTIDLDCDCGLFARLLRQKLIEFRKIDPDSILGS